MRSIIALALLVSLLPAFHLASQDGLKPHCKHTDKTDPKMLTGEQGERGGYFLRWTTDADKLDGKYSYVRILSNLDNRVLLPAKWEMAGIEYKEIKALDCYKNTIESGYPPKEEAKTKIQYGLQLNTPCEASLYVKDDSDPKKNISKGKEVLNSTLVTSDFKFTFSTSIEYKEKKPKDKFQGRIAIIKYSAVGKNVGFKIDGLIKQLADLEKNKIIVTKTKWKTKEMIFIPGQEESQGDHYTIEYRGDSTIQEKEYQVEIFDEKDNSLAKGLVTAYVPPAK